MNIVGDAIPYVGAGGSGLALFMLGMFLTKKLPSPMEREILMMESRRKDETIAEKDEYIKKLVQDLADASDRLRMDVAPALATALSTLSRVEQEIMIRRNGVNN